MVKGTSCPFSVLTAVIVVEAYASIDCSFLYTLLEDIVDISHTLSLECHKRFPLAPLAQRIS